MDFAAEGHVYSDAGRAIPSVTQILNPSAAKPWYSHESAARGTLAHERCASWAIKPEAFPYEPYVDAFALWTWKHKPEWVKLESIIDGKIDGYRYAGRLDGLARIDGRLTVIDWKTGAKAKWHHAQVGAYALVEKPAQCLVLYLHDDMTYTEDWLTPGELVAGMQYFRESLARYYELLKA